MNDYKSEQLNELFAALSKAQTEIRVAERDSSNPFFKSSYANLQSIIEASRPALCKNNLAVTQQIISDNGQDYLVTMLCHASGQWLSSRMRIAPAKSDIQSLGSCITYLRRYSYAALVGVYDGQEDDDGNHAVHYEAPKPKDNGYISVDELNVLERELHGHEDITKSLLNILGVTHLRFMKKEVFPDMFKRIKEIIANKPKK